MAGTTKRERPDILHGVTTRCETPLGTAYITINSTPDGCPFEVFLSVGKGGTDVAAISEGFGRLISLILRMPSNETPNVRLKHIVDQLVDIGGRSRKRIGKHQLISLPDAIAQALNLFMNADPANATTAVVPAALAAEYTSSPRSSHVSSSVSVGQFCSECNNYTMIPAEGCLKCTVCGNSHCG